MKTKLDVEQFVCAATGCCAVMWGHIHGKGRRGILQIWVGGARGAVNSDLRAVELEVR